MCLWKALILIALCKTVDISAETQSASNVSFCETGWTQYGPYCYKLMKRGLSWDNASASCITLGGHLASIHSKEQSDFVNDLLKTKIPIWDSAGSFRWIGLHYIHSNKTFVWTDGSDFNFSNWEPSEPISYGRTNSVAIRFLDANSTGKWTVEAHYILLPYVCQKQISAQTKAVTEITEKDDDTAVTESTETDDAPGIHMYLPLLKEHFDSALVPTTTYPDKERDGYSGFISITSFIITLTVIALMILMVGVVYYRRTWLKYKHMKLHTVLFRNNLTNTEQSTEKDVKSEELNDEVLFKNPSSVKVQ